MSDEDPKVEVEAITSEAVGVISISEGKNRAKAIEEVMRQAILKACEEGISIVENPDEIKKRMLEARDKFKADEQLALQQETVLAEDEFREVTE